MKQAAVIGAGTMGNGIAHVFAQHGWEVTLIDVAPAALEKATGDDPRQPRAPGQEGHARRRRRRTRCSARIATGTDARRRGAAPSSWSRRRARTRPSSSPSSSSSTGSPRPDAILATNTSSISITEIAARDPAARSR